MPKYDEICLTCDHTWGKHSQGDDGPCILAGCTCPHFGRMKETSTSDPVLSPATEYKCEHKNQAMSEKHKGKYCVDCRVWLTKKCNNKSCEFCQTRPDIAVFTPEELKEMENG